MAHDFSRSPLLIQSVQSRPGTASSALGDNKKLNSVPLLVPSAQSRTGSRPSTASSALGDNRKPNSVPPWVNESLEESLDESPKPSLSQPSSAVPADHHYLPASQPDRPRGRKWDQQRDARPAMLNQPLAESSARWKPYMRSGPQPYAKDIVGSRFMTDEWMEANMLAWVTGDDRDDEASNEKPRPWLLRRGSVTGAKRTLLRNPFVPLVFRLIVTTFTLAALGLGARVWHQTHKANHADPLVGCSQRASTSMAIVLDCIAVPYIIYVTRDEYTSKPLGLRSATAKTFLLLVDLYFVVFYSSNLTLAFASLTDTRWACYQSDNDTCPRNDRLCDSQTGLVAVLFVALMAWLITFSISVLRVVKRLRPDE